MMEKSSSPSVQRFPWRALVDTRRVAEMIVRRGTLWAAVAVLVLLASVSSSGSVKLRKPRKRTTTRIPYQQSRTGPVVIRVMHKYADDGVARGASGGCANGNCNGKFHLGANEAMSEEDNFLSDEESLRYAVHPERYEHFVLRKNTGHAGRYRRDSAPAGSQPPTDLDRGAVPRNETRGNVTRVPLHRIDRARGLAESVRARRSLAADYSSRRNDSDYFTQRKAIMDKYYARQREINALYADLMNIVPRSEHNVSQYRPASTGNATLFSLGRVSLGRNSTARDGAIFRHSPTKLDPIYSNETRYNKTELDNRRNVALDVDPGFKSDANLSEARSSGSAERSALDHIVTPTPCTNLSSSGTFAPKTRPRHAKNCTHDGCDRTSIDYNASGNLRWGTCEGSIVYQHNLLLGLTGPSNLDALFEVIIQGPVCITCVETLRYNETRATVTLDSGGRGHEYAKLRLQGYENEGFSYIIKVWGVKKTGQVCDNVD
ncbi:PREDICTED: uncharacterized protein LOC105562009 [Vollenhovia emeryi]|uniref:uncharacterized protein LOC105562009 n=1 Tax=Vollenhovia emeryi TaxID=411798 RepID=UPI0005F360CB|nr:PREDICTED: uncharacterized protein LOC105562009 [Vollenhovia emeryi]